MKYLSTLWTDINREYNFCYFGVVLQARDLNMDWLDEFLDNTTPVINDKMMTDAVPPPHIKSEHSYSIADDKSSSSVLNDRLLDLELHSDNLTAGKFDERIILT